MFKATARYHNNTVGFVLDEDSDVKKALNEAKSRSREIFDYKETPDDPPPAVYVQEVPDKK